MNTNANKPERTNRLGTTVGIGVGALILGLIGGAATAETGCFQKANQPAAAATNRMPATAANNLLPGEDQVWNPFQQVRDAEAQMDQSFGKMVDELRTDPQFNAFKDVPGYSLSLDVRDLKNKYEVRAYLPDAKTPDVHVSLKDKQTLDVQVSDQESRTSGPKNAETSLTEFGQYEQTVQLPTPVKADQMKVRREGHELDITIPKAV